MMNQYAPNFTAVGDRTARSVAGRISKQRFGLTGGNIMQGRCRSSASSSCGRCPDTPTTARRFAGLYLCGAATHPGGGVMGACGYNAAREIQRDVRAG